MNNWFCRTFKKFKIKNNLSPIKNLPLMFFFSNEARVKNIFYVIENLSKNSAIIIREYDLNTSQRLDFAKKIINAAKKRSIKVFIGKDWRLAIKLKADGVHFSDYDNIAKCCWKSHKISKKLLISYSCHSQKLIKKAEKYGCDLIFYSPIFATQTHPQQKPVGIFELRKLISKTSIPIYALGGIDKKNIKILNNCNIAGIGGISIFNTNKIK